MKLMKRLSYVDFWGKMFIFYLFFVDVHNWHGAPKYLPIWPNGKKTDIGHFLFGHVATIKVSLKMGLDGFFGHIFLLETIK